MIASSHRPRDEDLRRSTDNLKWFGLTKRIALSVTNPDFTQGRKNVLALDAFGDRLFAQHSCHADNHFDHGTIDFVVQHLPHEAAVDLDVIDWKMFQVTKGRHAGAKAARTSANGPFRSAWTITAAGSGTLQPWHTTAASMQPARSPGNDRLHSSGGYSRLKGTARTKTPELKPIRSRRNRAVLRRCWRRPAACLRPPAARCGRFPRWQRLALLPLRRSWRRSPTSGRSCRRSP